MDHQETRHGHEGTQPYLPPVTPTSVSTAQLPADVEPFIGRTAELSALEKLAVKDSDVDRAQVILIHGRRGVGKSVLAVHFAHKIKRHTATRSCSSAWAMSNRVRAARSYRTPMSG